VGEGCPRNRREEVSLGRPVRRREALVQPNGLSRYDSLQISLQRRLTNNWQGQFSYTGSHSYDIESAYWGEGGAFTGGTANPHEAIWDLGPSSFNRANVITANSVYMLPFKQNRLVSGWQASGIFTYTSGQPLTVTTGVNQAWAPQNTPERPNYIAGCNWQVGTPTEWYNPACFTIPPVGIIGNLGRFALVGPGEVNQDFSVMKSTSISTMNRCRNDICTMRWMIPLRRFSSLPRVWSSVVIVAPNSQIAGISCRRPPLAPR